nr:uncharacterized protein LOC108133348 [Drosophila bipectinata]
MLIPCLWTTLPWIVLGQTYYLSFVFNNFRYSDKPAEIYAPDLGMPNNKNTKSPNKEEKTLELVSMERSDERKISKPIPDREPEDDDTLELSSAERSHDSEEDESIWIVATTPRKPKKTTKKKKKTSRRPTTLSTEMDTPESPEEITTESTKATPTVGKPTAEIPKESREDDAKESNKNSTSATESPSGNPQGERPEPTPKESTISPEEWNILQGIRSHPPEFFSYPEARCHEDMDLHEVFGISLERDRGLPSKVLCTFNNSWGGPWLLTTRIELPVRLHMRQWFFGYLTEDYKDLSANFLALAHIMNSMRTAMLILGQDNSNRLVYNLYDDVVISSINDLFLLRKAELVEANTPDLLFGSVGKVFNLFSGRNRTCPLQVLGGWWASEAQSDW